MTTLKTCPQCGKPLTENAPLGLCPACLIKAGQATETGLPAGATPSAEPILTPLAPSLGPAEVSRLFPQLEILELLGRGGMGVVYKARQRQLDRLVALKIMLPEVARDPAFAERFSREAKALARLNHPNIVAVYDFGQSSGHFYFMMEFVDGTNLRQALAARQITPEAALAIVPKLCEALQFAHDEGILHRDIKPENILLDKKGRVKIADFGLAKLTNQSQPDLTLTNTGATMGTPKYMAPEQIENTKSVDHRADIYSLGVVFYEMLTGELPLGRFAPPSQKVQVDVRLDEVVLHTLEKEPERRYQQVREVKTAVEQISGTTGAPVPPLLRPAEASAEDVATVAARRQVLGPATGLVIAAVLNWLALPIVLSIMWRAGSFSQGAMPQYLPLLVVGILMAGSGLILLGALKMRGLESLGLARLASALSMIIGPGYLVGWPVGIWSLVVLSRTQVKAAFQQQRKRPSAANAAGWWPVALGAGLHTAMLLAIAGILVVVVPRHLAMFREMDVALPWLTQAVAGVSRLVLNGGYWLLPVLIALDVVLGWLARNAGGRKLVAAWAIAGLLGLGGVAAVAVLAVSLPLNQMVAGLKGQPTVTYLEGHSAPVAALAASDRWLVSAGLDGRVIVHDLMTGAGRRIAVDISHPSGKPASKLRCVAITRDGQHAMVGGDLRGSLLKIRLDRPQAAEVISVPNDLGASIHALATQREENRIAYLTSADRQIVFYDIARKKIVASSPIPTGSTMGHVGCLAVSPGGNPLGDYLAVTSANMVPDKGGPGSFVSADPCKLTVFDEQGVERLSWQFPDHADFLNAQVVFPNHRTLVVCLPSGKMMRWRQDGGGEWIPDALPVRITPGRYTACAASRIGHVIWLAENLRIIGIDAQTGAQLASVELKIGERRGEHVDSPIQALASAEGHVVAAALWDGRVALARCELSPPLVADTALKSFAISDPVIAANMMMEGNGWSANCPTGQTLRLFEIPDPGVDNCLVVYRAQLNTQELKGRAYLEMWCRLPGQGEFFGRGLDKPVAGGQAGWTDTQTEFFLKAGQRPDLIRLNLVVEGAGRIGIRFVEVRKIVKPQKP